MKEIEERLENLEKLNEIMSELIVAIVLTQDLQIQMKLRKTYPFLDNIIKQIKS